MVNYKKKRYEVIEKKVLHNLMIIWKYSNNFRLS